MSKHDRTLEAIFAEPTLGSIAWRDIEALFIHHGAIIKEAKGSGIRITLNGEKAFFHRPHPGKETSKGAVESARIFLSNAGITPP